jgi:hypothetical protein
MTTKSLNRNHDDARRSPSNISAEGFVLTATVGAGCKTYAVNASADFKEV